MAPPVYSFNLQRIHVSTTLHSVVVPDGLTWILRDIDVVLITNPYPVALEISIPGPLFVLYHAWTSSADDFHWQWAGRQVFESGDTLQFQMTAGAADLYASGYQLTPP
jgi:hypothetical protein